MMWWRKRQRQRPETNINNYWWHPSTHTFLCSSSYPSSSTESQRWTVSRRAWRSPRNGSEKPKSAANQLPLVGSGGVSISALQILRKRFRKIGFCRRLKSKLLSELALRLPFRPQCAWPDGAIREGAQGTSTHKQPPPISQLHAQRQGRCAFERVASIQCCPTPTTLHLPRLTSPPLPPQVT